jgi:integral membrane sensor domain MASE1
MYFPVPENVKTKHCSTQSVFVYLFFVVFVLILLATSEEGATIVPVWICPRYLHYNTLYYYEIRLYLKTTLSAGVLLDRTSTRVAVSVIWPLPTLADSVMPRAVCAIC